MTSDTGEPNRMNPPPESPWIHCAGAGRRRAGRNGLNRHGGHGPLQEQSSQEPDQEGRPGQVRRPGLSRGDGDSSEPPMRSRSWKP